MNKEQLHGFISQSTGNESNICQIYAIKDGEAVLDDNFHGFKTEDAIKTLATGEALISFLSENGEPNIVERAFILPPQSFMGTITNEERDAIIKQSRIYMKYETVNNEESASEKVETAKKTKEEKIEAEKKAAEEAKEKEKQDKLKAKEEEKKKKEQDKMMKKVTNQVTNKVIGKATTKVVNSLWKNLFK